MENLKNKYIKAIYSGVSAGDSYKKIHQELYDLTINSKVFNRALYKQAVKVLKQVNKKMPKNEGGILAMYGNGIRGATATDIVGIRSIIAISLIDDFHINQGMEQTIYHEINHEEGKKKEEIIDENIDENRKLENPHVFYLASDHSDSALDHKDRQGKMFIDKDWKKYVKNEGLVEEIKKYIARHNTKTIQWVTGKPVWFITRPNCRHYFKDIDTFEALDTSVEELIKRKGMHREIGRRLYIQTLKHPTNKKWYQDIENAKSLLNKYRERLKYHEELYTAMPNDLLKNAIAKDKMLIKKWSDYLQSRK